MDRGPINEGDIDWGREHSGLWADAAPSNTCLLCRFKIASSNCQKECIASKIGLALLIVYNYFKNPSTRKTYFRVFWAKIINWLIFQVPTGNISFFISTTCPWLLIALFLFSSGYCKCWSCELNGDILRDKINNAMCAGASTQFEEMQIVVAIWLKEGSISIWFFLHFFDMELALILSYEVCNVKTLLKMDLVRNTIFQTISRWWIALAKTSEKNISLRRSTAEMKKK